MTLSRTDVGSWTSSAGYGTGSYATGSFTPPANSLLIIFVSMMGNGISGDLGQPTISGGGLSYTFRGHARGDAAWSLRLNVFTAEVGGSPSSMTVTVDDDDNQEIYTYAVAIVAFTGYNATTPISGWTDSGTTDIGDGAETQTLTASPTVDDVSLLSTSLDAAVAPNNPTYGAGWTEIYDVSVLGGGASLVVARRENSTSTSVSVTDVYTDVSFTKGSMLSFIVKDGGWDGFARIVTGNSTNGTTLSGGVSLNMPTGIEAGDLLIAFATNDNTGGVDMGISGWTQLFFTEFANTANTISHGAWAKIAVGGDTATLTGASQDYVARVLRIANHGVSDIATDIKVGSPAQNTSATTDTAPNPPSLDAGSSKKWLWIASASSDDDDDTTPYGPASYTEDSQVQSASSTSSTLLQTAWRKNETQTENPGAFALAAAEEWIANVIAIPPTAPSVSLIVDDRAKRFQSMLAR